MNIVFRSMMALLLVSSIAGCAKAPTESTQSMPAAATGEAPAPAAAAPEGSKDASVSKYSATQEEKKVISGTQQVGVEERKIIKQGVVTFKSYSVTKTKKKIEEAIKGFDGYIVNENETRLSNRIEQKIVVKVPSDKFDQFLGRISEGVTTFDEKNITSTDVTEEFIDTEARLKIKKDTERRYLELFKQAKSVPDVLAIEQQIGTLREEIESMEGRLKYLQHSIAMSTLTITVYEDISSQVSFFSEFGVRFINGWNSFIWILIILTELWPFTILAVVVGIFIKISLSKKAAIRRKKAKE